MRSRAGVRSSIGLERTAAALVAELGVARLRDHLVGPGALVVHLEPDHVALPAAAVVQLVALPLVTIGVVHGEPRGDTWQPVDGRAEPNPVDGPDEASWPRALDLVVSADDDSLDAVLATVADRPLASCAYALLLRGTAGRDLAGGLVAESTTYSMLQAGPEFAAWRAERPRRTRVGPDGDPVLVDRVGDTLVVTLHRPHVRNALDTPMRDALVDALAIAHADPSIAGVELRGAGPAFCAGGDLDEFGSFADPVSAHLVRLERSVGRSIAGLGDRVTAYVHGACYGSGIELPAFAARVVADPGATFALPELRLGLVPGAGGTVSVTRRIGRHRTAWLGLSGRALDAHTAHRWGLVDEVAPVSPPEP
jgi:enoyl-CoA hydratase/carnithine racemase